MREEKRILYVPKRTKAPEYHVRGWHWYERCQAILNVKRASQELKMLCSGVVERQAEAYEQAKYLQMNPPPPEPKPVKPKKKRKLRYDRRRSPYRTKRGSRNLLTAERTAEEVQRAC